MEHTFTVDKRAGIRQEAPPYDEKPCFPQQALSARIMPVSGTLKVTWNHAAVKTRRASSANTSSQSNKERKHVLIELSLSNGFHLLKAKALQAV